MAFCGYLKQSTASTLAVGPFVDATDGVTAETALTVARADCLLWKEGGTTLAQKTETTSATHRSNGIYTVPIDTTDTGTLGMLSLSVAVAGALPVRQDYQVVAAHAYDEQFNAIFAKGYRGIVTSGTAQSATGTTVVLAAAESQADSVMKGNTMMVYGSTQGYWQTRLITAYTNSTDTATVDAWDVTPSGTITYVVLASAPADATNLIPVDVKKWNATTVATPATAGYPAVTIKSGTGTGELNLASGVVDANATKVSGTSQTARDLGASVLISSGTGTGQLDVTSGVIKANLAQILGTALTETAGLLAAGFKQFFNIASPTSTMNTITTVTTATNLTNAPTAGDLTATMKTSVKTQVTDALNVDTYAEPSSVPAATTTLTNKIGFLFTKSRNKITQTATTQLVRNDGDSATIGTSTVSDDGTTAIRGKFV